MLIETKALGAHAELGIGDIFTIYNGIYNRPRPFKYSSHCEYQIAWMMWPYTLGGLSCGAWVIRYEGSPFYPNMKSFLKFIDEQNYLQWYLLKNASSAYVPLIALICLVRVPDSASKFRDAHTPSAYVVLTMFSYSGPPACIVTLEPPRDRRMWSCADELARYTCF